MPIGPIPRRVCSKCGESKPLTRFYLGKNYRGGRMTHCKECHKEYNEAKMTTDPRYRLLSSSMSNARQNGREHSIGLDDIVLVEVCPYLGVTLDYRRASERGTLRAFDAPSIDRIDSTRGYVPGNVQVISDLANRMKQDATVEQLLAFAEGVLRRHGG